MAYKNRTERVAEIREELKREFPDFKFSIRKDGYNGVRIAILSAPINLLEGEPEGTKYIDVNNYYIDENFKDVPAVRDVLKKIYGIASRGVTYRETGDYGTQPDFYVYIKIGEYDKPFEFIPKKGRTPRSTSGASTPSSSSSAKWDRGEVIRECAGWKAYKKTLPDGRIVYNVVKDKDTPSNKGDWNAIKGEIYTESGFKWGRFGAFEKWGEMSTNDANLLLDRMCSVLSKYYSSSTTPSTPESTPAPMPSESESGSQDKVTIYINGQFYETAPSQMDATLFLGARYGGAKYNEMLQEERITFDNVAKRVDVVEGDMFEYGKSWGVPKSYGKELTQQLIFKGFKVYISKKRNILVIYKTDMASDGMTISDNGGEFNLERYGYNEFISSINYELDKRPAGVVVLSELITDIYEEYYSTPKDTPKEQTTSKEDLRKAIAGLQILADKGNEKAKKAIIGLKILLNK